MLMERLCDFFPILYPYYENTFTLPQAIQVAGRAYITACGNKYGLFADGSHHFRETGPARYRF